MPSVSRYRVLFTFLACLISIFSTTTAYPEGDNPVIIWDLVAPEFKRIEVLDYIDHLGNELADAGVAVMTRTDRDRAFGRLSYQIDPAAQVSTITRIAGQIGVNSVVYGKIANVDDEILVSLHVATGGIPGPAISASYSSLQNALERTPGMAREIEKAISGKAATVRNREVFSVDRLQFAIGFSRIFDTATFPAGKYLVTGIRSHYDKEKIIGLGLTYGTSYTPDFGGRQFVGSEINIWMPYLDFSETGRDTDTGGNAVLGVYALFDGDGQTRGDLSGNIPPSPIFHFEICPLTLYIGKPDLIIEMLRGGMYLNILTGDVAFSMGFFRFGWRFGQ